MVELSRLKNIIAPQRDKVSVDVCGQVEQLTRTQAYRFDQLSKTWEVEEKPSNPFERDRYSLEEAALDMLQSEPAVLRDASEGLRVVYVNAGGMSGRWRYEQEDGSGEMSQPVTLSAGYLALPRHVCVALADAPSATAAVLEYRPPQDPAVLGFQAEVLAELERAGPGAKAFCLSVPVTIDRRAVTLFAPLIDSD